MAERRIAWTVADEQDARHEGEVVVMPAWRPDLELNPDAAFTIVLTEEPLPPDAAPPPRGMIVCAPATPVRLPSVVAEERTTYRVGQPSSPLRLPKRALAAYAAGTVLAPAPLSTTVRDVFGGDEPRLDLLARQTIARGSGAARYWETLRTILSWPGAAPRRQAPRRIRARLAEALRAAPAPPPDAAAAIERLRRIAGGEAPDEVAASPAELREDAALLRCLAEQPDAARELAAMRAYLDGAAPGDAARDLLSDRAFLREQLSFATLLTEPHQLTSLRASFEQFRDEYVRAYIEQHLCHWSAWDRLREQLAEGAPAVDALTRLNTLRALGRPLGEDEIAAYAALTGEPACARRDLAADLQQQARCPACGLAMIDVTPAEEVARALRGVQAALGRQQARLASEAVRRILARGGERIDRFLQVAQASDLAGLAQVLDDELLAFLGGLLAEAPAPTPEALDLFETLARDYPVITEEQIEAASEALRRLLREQLAAQRAADPARLPSFRLAAESPAP
ncbi:MAG: hypothetical protein HY723_04840 [Chloroflexi bacterium]|nr:hypothetical protein [Chloroflexota bacterium]